MADIYYIEDLNLKYVYYSNVVDGLACVLEVVVFLKSMLFLAAQTGPQEHLFILASVFHPENYPSAEIVSAQPGVYTYLGHICGI